MNRDPCPSCGKAGRRVKRVTLERLLCAEQRSDIGDGPYCVCASPDCPTVYFSPGDGAVFDKADLTVRFGLKEKHAPRPVCYCFDHTVEEIEDEIARTGGSAVLDSIKVDMKGPGCRCEYTNPLGACCLKTVQAAVATAMRSAGREVEVAADPGDCCAGTENFSEEHVMENCCTTKTNDGTENIAGAATDCCETANEPRAPRGGDRAGAFAAGGSVLAAVFSSACCWLPLLLIAFGASAAGVAGFFDVYRGYFIVGSVALLGVGYYMVYFRKERCDPGTACATPNRKLQIVNRVMLGVATVLVGIFIFFPNYVGALFCAPASAGADVSSASSAAPARLATAEFNIGGMTCEGCSDILRGSLAKLPDIVAVDVSYPAKTAVVRYEADRPVSVGQVVAAVKAAGYTANLTGIVGPTLPQPVNDCCAPPTTSPAEPAAAGERAGAESGGG